MGKVIGIGGIFMKFNNPKAMTEWYEAALGLQANEYGVLFAFNNVQQEQPSYLQLGVFQKDTDYFGTKEQQYMLNFRVENLDSLILHLQQMGTSIVDELTEYEYGKFIHILDPEGNRIELWEPIDHVFSNEKQEEMR
jgi:predicted enzyme related to lactoylglutathione lyase